MGQLRECMPDTRPLWCGEPLAVTVTHRKDQGQGGGCGERPVEAAEFIWLLPAQMNRCLCT